MSDEKLDQILTALAVQGTKLDTLTDSVMGSQRGPGVVQRVDVLESGYDKMKGGQTVIAWLGAIMTFIFGALEFALHRGHR